MVNWAELDQEMDKLLLVGNNLIIFKRADTAPPMDLPHGFALKMGDFEFCPQIFALGQKLRFKKIAR